MLGYGRGRWAVSKKPKLIPFLTKQPFETIRSTVTSLLDGHFRDRHKGRFPFVRTGRPDHCPTSLFEKQIGFFQEFLLKTYLLRAYYLGFD